jgi:hypothetical protein
MTQGTLNKVTLKSDKTTLVEEVSVTERVTTLAARLALLTTTVREGSYS